MDYSRNVLDVYRELAIGLPFRVTDATSTSSHNIMHILSETQGRGMLSLPSWVPDWAMSSEIHFDSIMPMNLHAIAGEGYYKAAGDSKVRIERTSDPNKICLSGKICDAVRIQSSIALALTQAELDATSIESLNASCGNYDKLRRTRLSISRWIDEPSSIASTCVR